MYVCYFKNIISLFLSVLYLVAQDGCDSAYWNSEVCANKSWACRI